MEPKPWKSNKNFDSNTNFIFQCALNKLKEFINDYGPLTSLKDVISSHLLYCDLCTDHTDLR